MTLLVRHPDTPPGAIRLVEAELARVPHGAVATFRAVGDMARIVIPPPARPERTEGLWQSTCFELFVAGEDTSYREYNFSPSGAWAAFAFDDYRAGMRAADARIEVEFTHDANSLSLIAKIEAELPDPAHVGLTAVIEETDGAIRYWSSGFAPGKPDFHAPAVRSLLFDGVGTE
jgi:hypothetical protein